MKNKMTIIIITIIFFIVIVNYLIEPAKSDESDPEELEEMIKIQKEFNQLSIDYLNMQGENEELQKNINWLYEEKFEIYKRIYGSDFANEYIGETREIIHKEIEEEKFMLLVENETGYALSVWFKGQQSPYLVEFNTLEPENEFDLDYDFGLIEHFLFFGGIVTNDNLEQVRVLKNKEAHGADIIKIDDNLLVWYSIIDYEQKRNSNEINGVKIEALDIDGEILWEEIFR